MSTQRTLQLLRFSCCCDLPALEEDVDFDDLTDADDDSGVISFHPILAAAARTAGYRHASPARKVTAEVVGEGFFEEEDVSFCTGTLISMLHAILLLSILDT